MFRSYVSDTCIYARGFRSQVARNFCKFKLSSSKICKELESCPTINPIFASNNASMPKDVWLVSNMFHKFNHQRPYNNFVIKRNYTESTLWPAQPGASPLQKLGNESLFNEHGVARTFAHNSNAMLGNKSKILEQKLNNRRVSILIKRHNCSPKSIKMNYEIHGGKNGKENPVLVMHGLLGSSQNWRTVSKALAERLQRRVYNLDARNHGKSPHLKQHNAEYICDDIFQLTQDEGLKKINFMGHFMGGRAFLYFSLKHPELVNRGVVVEFTPFAKSKREMNDIFQTIKSMKVPQDLTVLEGRTFAGEQLLPIIKDKESVDYILTNLRKKPDGEFHWTVNVNVLQETMRTFPDFLRKAGQINPYQGDLLFICGKISNCANKSNWPGIKKVFPKAGMPMVDAVHISTMPDPKKFLEMVVEFLC